MAEPLSWIVHDSAFSDELAEAVLEEVAGEVWDVDSPQDADRTARQCQYIYPRCKSFSDELDQILQKLAADAAASFCVDLSAAIEQMIVLRYRPGDFVDWHYDLSQGTNAHRKLSVVAMLSDPSEYTGGVFEFFPNRVVALERGSVVVFPSYIPHRVTPIEQGTRVTAAAFFHGPVWR
jgi:predicted 2-oxoglutarate/Fe(II)-dependent dioxygenase YbiX